MSIEGPAAAPYADNAYNQIVGNTELHHRLFSAHWEMTYRCTERCSHCYLDVVSPRTAVPGELTTAECCRIIDELAAMGALNLTVSGGEFMARPDWFEITQYARSKHFLLRLFTNGIMMTPTTADRIASLHPYAVEISVYSVNAGTHDRITRLPRSFELTTRALRLLHERGVRTVMKTPLMHDNVYEFHQLEAMAKTLQAQFRYDITITAKDNGGLSPLVHRMTFDELAWLFNETMRSEEWLQRHVTPEQHTCGIAGNAIEIDPYGNVSSCVGVRTSAGNLREKSLKEIWENSPIWGELRGLTVGELPVCRTCELRNLCMRCHGSALVEDGDMRAPASTNCREALARRQVLVQRGDLPADFPIPAHLREMHESNSTFAFIPANAIEVR